MKLPVRPAHPLAGERRPLGVHAALLSLGLGLACGGSGPGGPPPPDPCALPTPGAPWLAFVSNRSGDYEVWRARSDGTCLTQVTHDPAADLEPTWSRTAIAFASERGAALRLWLHDLATDEETAVEAGDLASATAPAFSPDGSRLAFEGRAPGAATSDVYLVDARGGTPVALAPHAANDAGPAWSPDGQSIYFVSTRSGGFEIWNAPLDGGAPAQITTGSGIVGKPAVSSDGATLAYTRTTPGTAQTEVVLLALADRTVTLVSSLDDSEPAFAPAGAACPPLSLRSFRAGHADIVLDPGPGASPVFVTDDAASDGAPAFAPAP